jgi:hypothetical protein
MFSDKYKFFKITIPLFLILLAVFYGEIKGPTLYPGYLEAIKAPELYFGKEIGFGGKITEIQDNYILIKSDKEKVKVNLALPQENLNYQISGMAVLQKDLSLEPVKYHLSNLRKYKIFISLIPLVAISYLFFKKYRL